MIIATKIVDVRYSQENFLIVCKYRKFLEMLIFSGGMPIYK